MKNILDFFNQRSNNLKELVSIDSSSSIVAKYNFIVSNSRANDHDVIEIDSLFDLDHAVSMYFSETDTDPKSRIIKSANLDETKQMYVLLQLSQ